MPGLKNKPVVLMPLRLEIYHHSAVKIVPAPVATGPTLPSDNGFPGYHGEPAHANNSNWSHPQFVRIREIWIRWYPDDCMIFPNISPVTDKEEKAFKEYCDRTGCSSGEGELQRAWLDFVREVGLYRARYIAGNGGKYIEAGESDALQQFMDRGAELKALPEKVMLYTYHEKAPHPADRVKLLAEGNTIPNDLVISAGDNRASLWVNNFEEAVRVGMAIKLTEAAQCDQVDHADWLIAVGCKNDDAGILEELLLRYKAIGALEVLAQDEPTNNTENVKTSYTSNENGTEKAGSPISSMQPAMWNTCGGDIISHAFNINREVFEGVKNAELEEQAAAAAMSNLLWDSCTRMYHEFYMKYGKPDGSIVFDIKSKPEIWKQITHHFKSYVLGRGIVPPIRIGDNPYGILPATSLDEWESSEWSSDKGKQDFQNTTAAILRIFKNAFMHLSQSSAYVDIASPKDRFEKLVEVLQHSPVSKRIDVQAIPKGKQLDQVNRGFDADMNLLACDLVSSDRKLDYLDELLSYLNSMFGFDYSENYDNPSTAGLLSPMEDKAPLLKRLLFDSAAFLEKKLKDAFYLNNMSDIQSLKEQIEIMIWEVEGIKSVPVEKLEVLLKEVLDCLSYRLDAWISSLANMRLFEMNHTKGSVEFGIPSFAGRKKLSAQVVYDKRKGLLYIKDVESREEADRILSLLPEAVRKRMLYNPVKETILFKGVINKQEADKIIKRLEGIDKELDALDQIKLIGAYGWLEKPSASGIKTESSGYFQAPSLDQASTGAILRNAVLSKEDIDSMPFQVNLSSNRVKKAAWFTEGLRNGFTPAELLGYLIERKIHEYGLDQYLLDLRKAVSETNSSDAVKAPSLIHGENFIEPSFSTQIESIVTDTNDLAKVKRIISEVSQVGDAASDLYMVEALYATIRGNTARTAAWLDVMEGKNIPPSLESIITPRTGIPQLQRVVFALDAKSNPINDLTSPRILIDPQMSTFTHQQFADFKKQCIPVKVYSKEKPEEYIELQFTLDQLAVEPEDFIAGGTEELLADIRLQIFESVLEGKIETQFLNKQALSSCELEVLENLCYVEPIYDTGLDGQPPFRDLINCTESLKLFFNGIRSLSYEDMYEPARTGLEDPDFLDKLLAAKKSSYDWLKERLGLISKSLAYDRKKLDMYSKKIPGQYVDETRRLFAKIRRYGIKEAAIPVPTDDCDGCLNVFYEKIKVLFEKLDNQIVEIQKQIGSLEYVSIDNGGVQQDIQLDSDWDKIDSSIKYTLISKLIDNAISYLIKNVSGGGLKIIPPFCADELIAIDSNSFMEWDIESAFGEYTHVRKSLNKVVGYADQSKMVYSRFCTQKSREEILNQALLKAVAFKKQDVTDWALLAACFNKAASTNCPGLTYIWSLLDETAQKAINSFNPVNGIQEKDAQVIIDGLNNVLAMRNFYSKEDYKGITLSMDAVTLLKDGQETLSKLNGLMLNRYVFEDTMISLVGSLSFIKFITLEEISKLEAPDAGSMDIHYMLDSGGLNVAKGHPFAAFIADEWSIFLPSQYETTAVAYNFDAPQAEAPQVLLVAVPPKIDPYEKWENIHLARIIADTVDLVRVRSVSSEMVIGGNLGYIFPALLFGNNGRFPHTELPQIDGSVQGGYYYQTKQ